MLAHGFSAIPHLPKLTFEFHQAILQDVLVETWRSSVDYSEGFILSSLPFTSYHVNQKKHIDLPSYAHTSCYKWSLWGPQKMAEYKYNCGYGASISRVIT